MPNVITRYFDSAERAYNARFELIHRRRFRLHDVHMVEDAATAAAALADMQVHPDSAKAYADKLKSGGAVVLISAGHRPLTATAIAREVTAQFGAADMGDMVEEVEVPEPKADNSTIFKDHRLFLSKPRDPLSSNYHMASWPVPLISRRKPFTQMLFDPHARMADWPFKLLTVKEPFTEMLFDPHARMASFPIGLISKRKPFTGSIFSRHARMANFPIGLISRRKPSDRFAFPRHRRMANWPWPHLINGKTGTTALIPGAPRMANFPIGLLSRRKPYTGSAIPRHGRMANFPIGLVSKRKPFTGSIFSKHARMANFPLPLVVRDSAKTNPRKGFLISRMFGLPTLIDR